MVVEKLSGVCWLLEGSHHEQNGVPVVTCECVYARQSEFSVNGCSGWFDQHSCTFRAPRCGTDLVAGLHYCLFSLIFEITNGASFWIFPQDLACFAWQGASFLIVGDLKMKIPQQQLTSSVHEN